MAIREKKREYSQHEINEDMFRSEYDLPGDCQPQKGRAKIGSRSVSMYYNLYSSAVHDVPLHQQIASSSVGSVSTH